MATSLDMTPFGAELAARKGDLISQSSPPKH